MSHNPKLPSEIIYHIIKHLPPNNVILINLTYCSRWFYETCNPLIYQDIHLYRPIQLVRLYENEESRRRLDTTHTLRVAESIFHDMTWEGIATTLLPVDYLVHILSATINLGLLQVLNENDVFAGPNSRPTSILLTDFRKQVRSLVGNNAQPFIPKMHSLHVTIGLYHLFGLFRRRPPVFFSISSGDAFIINVLPDYNQASLSNTNTSQSVFDILLSVIPKNYTRAITGIELGNVIQDIITVGSTCCPLVNKLTVSIQPKNREGSNPPMVSSVFPWVWDMLTAANQSRIKKLQLEFFGSGTNMSLGAQFEFALNISKDFPAITELTLGAIQPEWRNRTHEAADDSIEYPSLPAWTPRPNQTHPEVLGWWMDALKLERPEIQNIEDLRRTAGALRGAMSSRWVDLLRADEIEAGNGLQSDLSVEALYQRLLAYV